MSIILQIVAAAVSGVLTRASLASCGLASQGTFLMDKCTKEVDENSDAMAAVSLMQIPAYAGVNIRSNRTHPTFSPSGPSPRSQAGVASSQELGRAKASAAGITATATEVCMSREDLPQIMWRTVDEVLQGLPPWNHSDVPAKVQDLRLAFLIQVSFESMLPVVQRTFGHLYSAQDTFVYLVDELRLDPSKVKAALPSPLPRNVLVQSSVHAGYFYWPRVQVLLDGFKGLLEQPWDFVVHLSESDYPLHTMNWIRESLASQRQQSFIKLTPRCSQASQGVVVDDWYWWTQHNAVASCGGAAPAEPVDGVRFPIEHLEEQGITFARAPEWFVLTREIVQYATSPELASFRRLIAMHAASDEMFWGTLILNIPGFSQDIGDLTWFELWRRGSTSHSPVTLTADHEKAILANRRQQLFMRKVSTVDSSMLLADMDALLAKPEAPLSVMEVASVVGEVKNHLGRAVTCPPMTLGPTSNASSNETNFTFAFASSDVYDSIMSNETSVSNETTNESNADMSFASSAPCACEADDQKWAAPVPRKPVCMFFDFGAADGNSYRDFLTLDSVFPPPGTGNDEGDFGSKEECYAYLVEANPAFDAALDMLARTASPPAHPLVAGAGSRIIPLTSHAAYMCDAQEVDFYIDPDPTHQHWGSALDGDHPSVRGAGAEVKVSMTNVLRLLKENTIPEDKVYVKVDIEGAEWDILPCLARSPEVVKLIDVLYVENHCPGGPGNPGWCPSAGQSGTTLDEYEAAVAEITALGVQMPRYFSTTL